MVDEIRALRLLSRATNNVSLPLIEASVEQAMRKALRRYAVTSPSAAGG